MTTILPATKNKERNEMKIHANQSLVTWSNNALKEKPNLFILSFYQADEQSKRSTDVYVCLRLILPMKVHVSPIYTLLTYNPGNAWRDRFTDSITMCMLLQHFLRCYTMIITDEDGNHSSPFEFCTKNVDLCLSVRKTLFTETSKLEEEFNQKLLDTPKITKDKFKVMIRTQTIKYIRLMERCLYELFLDGRANIKLEDCLTPAINPDNIKLNDDANTVFEEHFKIFFQTKDKTAKTNYFDFKTSIYPPYQSFLLAELAK